MKPFLFIYSVGFLALSVWLLPHTSAEPKISNTAMPAAADSGIAQVVRLAEAFKTTLNKEQLALLQLKYSKTDAVKWSNFPLGFARQKRVGLTLRNLSEGQLAAAKALMASVLAQSTANEGYDELQGILAADDYFGKATGKVQMFNAGNFNIAFLGSPSTTALWELQFGGHHLAFANTYNGGRLAGATPSFRGVEPMAPIKEGNRSYHPMEAEQAAFAGLIKSLTGAERTKANLSVTFSDVLLGPGRDGQFPEAKEGVRIGDLNILRRQLAVKAIELYVKDLDAATAKNLMAKYEAELPETYLSFSGSGTMNELNDYVRIDGPSIWIEYSAQPSRDFPGTVHPHSVWRDRTTDYGGN